MNSVRDIRMAWFHPHQFSTGALLVAAYLLGWGPALWAAVGLSAVADNIRGPYRKQPQVFLGGHIAVFTGPDGKEWLSYRGESGAKAQGRLCVDPIPFNEDGSVRPFPPSAALPPSAAIQPSAAPAWYPVPQPPEPDRPASTSV